MNQPKSIAVWCKKSQPDDEVCRLKGEMQLHINYWHISQDENKFELEKAFKGSGEIPDIMDIGLMVPLIRGLECISIYLPFKLEPRDIKDLSPTLIKNEISSAIFNEDLSHQVIGKQGESLFTLNTPSGEFCIVRNFISSKDGENISDAKSFKTVNIEDGEGTQLMLMENAFKLHNLSKSTDHKFAYFRLRVPLNSKNKSAFFRDIDPEDKALQSSYEKTEFIDFRINELRLLPQSVRECMQNEQGEVELPLCRVDFLLAVNIVADITGAMKEFHKSRLLEPNLWSGYFENEYSYMSNPIQKGMLVYHWKKVREEKKVFKDFSAFVKLKVRFSSYTVIRRHLWFIIFFGTVGSVIGSLLYSGLGVIWDAATEKTEVHEKHEPNTNKSIPSPPT